MSIRHDEQSGTSPVARVLTSVPWVVVLLGVSVLTVLLLVAVFALRGPEGRTVAPPPAPPIYLPTVAATTASAAPTDVPLVAVDASATPTPSASLSPSPSVSSPPSASASTRPAPRAGTVTARYQVTASGRDSFEARLTVSNGSARSQDWRVELFFSGNVKSIQASSSSGLSVTSRGNGSFVLRGTSPLGAGQSATVQMRFGRTGTGDRPGQCTVNGADCAIG
ncbi:cellulose binding domain-containing protein [Micromonospora coerulea]